MISENDITHIKLTVSQLLSSELPLRWQHIQNVAKCAHKVSSLLCTPSDSHIVTYAAWCHDIGYSSLLCKANFHPLDGARWLETKGISKQICQLVAYHSCAHIEAEFRGLLSELNYFGPFEHSLLSDILTFSDISIGPDGKFVGIEKRLSEVKSRYGPEHIVTASINKAEPQLYNIVNRIRNQLGTDFMI